MTGRVLLRASGVLVTIAVAWAALAAVTPVAMSQYARYTPRAGINCVPIVVVRRGVPTIDDSGCSGLADVYHTTFAALVVDSMLRSLALLAGAVVLALVVGTLLGVAIALQRHRAFAGGALMGGTSLLAAVPSFFVAYFLQIGVIVVGAGRSGGQLLPVFGFGYDTHVVLPLVAISLPAVTYTAQLTATRLQDVLDSDFVTTANAKGLPTSWIVGIHVLPHARPVILEALGSGLRVSVASLPVIEFLFNWRGSGQLAVEAVAVHDAATFVFCALVLVTLFATLSAIADLSRPRALYGAA
jgi:peptide/nickel transport system permease protein